MEPNKSSPEKNIVESAVIAGAATAKPQLNPHKEGPAYAVVPPGHKVEYLERPAFPFRKDGTVKLMDAESFIRYWTEEAEESSRIYGSLEPAQFIAVFNDHEDGPDWKDYRALFQLRHSKEWKVWTGRDKNDFAGNDAFAIWLEDNAIDIIQPDPAMMMDIALNMRVSQSQGFAKAVRLSDGNVQFTYSNTVDGSVGGGGNIKIPETFAISIPVFEGLTSPKYRVEAKFRYRLHSGTLTVRYELVRPHKVVEEAFRDICTKIEAETTKAILFGTPE